MVALVLATGCGFEPVYGGSRGTAVRAELQAVRVALIANRSGQQLRRYMLDRIHGGDQLPPAQYQLEVSVIENRQNFGIQRDLTATYARLTLTGYFTLRDLKTQQPVLSGSINSYSSYNVAADPFNTVVAETDARERAVRTLGDDLITRVAFYLRDPKAAATPS
ncbi:MAG: hypothetical protein HY060_05605 [Proteobacteria bacterium]|nr:hypothetical protein [Pseudomonadota bacterium]